MHVTILLPANPACPGKARELVRSELTDCDREAIAVVELLTSELVTNAVLHAGTWIELSLEDKNCVVTVEVTDGSSALPRVGNPREIDEDGRGLVLVESLATSWGVEEREHGKTVWFTVAFGASLAPQLREKRARLKQLLGPLR